MHRSVAVPADWSKLWIFMEKALLLHSRSMLVSQPGSA